MNSGALKGYPEQANSGKVLKVNPNGQIKPDTGVNLATAIKWGA